MIVRRILIDTREFFSGRRTGIGRVLEGLIGALSKSSIVNEIILVERQDESVPYKLKNQLKTQIRQIPSSFIASEKALSNFTKNSLDLFISPYPKLPLFGVHCLSVNIVHDVLDLTHPAYKKGLKKFFDGFRLKHSLKKADLTWYDSSWSKEETKKYAGFTGENPRVRFPGIDAAFAVEKNEYEENVIKKYGLNQGYILVLGNGLPHKNLGVLLAISDQLCRELVFVGVSQKNQDYWKLRYPKAKAKWVEHVAEKDLPSVIKGASCLAQPSAAEGYGYPPLEAMACGVPAVVSDIPVLVETTGGNALKADPYDSGQWLQAFEALEKPDIYQNQIEKGLKWVRPLQGRKGWEGHVSDIEELLNKEDRRQ